VDREPVEARRPHHTQRSSHRLHQTRDGAIAPAPASRAYRQPSDPARYFLVDLNTKNCPSVEGKLKRGAKELHLHTKSRNPEHQKILLQKAFFFLADKVNVEFHIHSRKPKKKEEKDYRIPLQRYRTILRMFLFDQVSLARPCQKAQGS
jgi:hypothetical protein